MMRKLPATILLLLSALACAPLAGANDVRPMLSGSLDKLLAARSGKPFVLAFWSVDCSHCPKEMRALGELKRRYPGLDLVLVSTDTPADSHEAAELARGYGLAGSEQWIFAESAPERLRAEIDNRWHGELPRTYFYDRGQRVDAVSGVVAPARLQRWAEASTR